MVFVICRYVFGIGVCFWYLRVRICYLRLCIWKLGACIKHLGVHIWYLRVSDVYWYSGCVSSTLRCVFGMHFYTTSFCGIYVGYSYYHVGLSHIFEVSFWIIYSVCSLV